MLGGERGTLGLIHFSHLRHLGSLSEARGQVKTHTDDLTNFVSGCLLKQCFVVGSGVRA